MALVANGIAASTVSRLAARTGMSEGVLSACLALSPAPGAHTLLPKDESERLLGMRSLIDMLQTIVEESGDPAGFDAARALSG